MSQGVNSIGPASRSDDKHAVDAPELKDLMRQGKSFSGRERHCSFLNLRDGKFADISAVSGLNFPDDGRAVARVDWDHDGDLDFWIVNRNGPQVRFMRNDVPQKNNFLSVRLQGRTCNRDAIGARVALYLKGEPVPRISTLSAGDGFLSQSSKTLHFGLGNATEIDRLIVHWPGGKKEEFSNLKINSHYHLEQQSGQATLLSPRPPLTLARSQLVEPPSSDQAQVLSTSRLPMPLLDYTTMTGQRQLVTPPNKGTPQQPILLNLWASWCPNCQAELKEWTQHAQLLRASGIRVLALSVDGLDGDYAEGVNAAKKLLQDIKFPFESGMATARTIEKLQMTHDHLFDVLQAIPVPTSFLIDPSGNIAAIYKGKVDASHILADIQHLQSKSAPQSQTLTGKWLQRPNMADPFILVWKMIEVGFLDEACAYIDQHGMRLAQNTEYPNLLTLAGTHRLARRQPQEAAALYRRALKAAPNYAEAQNNLAWLLATNANDQLRNGKEAVRLAESVARKMGQNPSYLDTLAAAYAEAGRFPEAVAVATKAIQLATSQGHTQMAKDIESRLKTYQASKPWREK